MDAGEQLAEELKNYKDEPGVILAVPRGGIPVAYPIAVKFGFPLSLVLAKKIGHPLYPEFAVGAASLDDYFIHPGHHVDETYVKEELKRIRTRLSEMQKLFLSEYEQPDLKGKTVIVVDDGIATGHTMLATIQLLRKKNPGKIIVAVPVATRNAIDILSKEVDDVVTVNVPVEFHGVGAFYHDFEQVSDEQVKHYLDELRRFKKTA
ncbi:MAG TPA: phosphoribosyltransferase family protein [Saprospiraceae bacterium]|nr:phosphoribosyltransferase family protein [Saprospiraceae bacterium]